MCIVDPRMCILIATVYHLYSFQHIFVAMNSSIKVHRAPLCDVLCAHSLRVDQSSGNKTTHRITGPSHLHSDCSSECYFLCLKYCNVLPFPGFSYLCLTTLVTAAPLPGLGSCQACVDFVASINRNSNPIYSLRL
jgi:hypothetical protein